MILRHVTVVIALALLLATGSMGAEYHVSPDGSDAAAGTQADPWRTLQRAADAVAPGDHVLVRAGTYTGFDLRTSGTAAARITFSAEEGVLINQRNVRTADGINLELASHVVIEGFKIVGVPRAGVRAVGTADAPSQGVVIRNVHADQNGKWGIFTGFAQGVVVENNITSRSQDEHGIYVSNSADNPVVRGNTSWGNRAGGIQLNADVHAGGDGIITGAVIEKNRLYDNGVGGGSAINLDGIQQATIRNNLIYGNHASGISLFQINGAEGSKDNVVVNNTIVQASDGRWALNIQNGSTGNTVLNNILWNEHGFRGALTISSDSLAGTTSDFNAVIDRFQIDSGSVMPLAQWRIQTGHDGNSFIASPAQLFVDFANNDYRLRPGSPAIDAGTSTHAPTEDLDGTPRPQGLKVDIGAYEVPEPAGAATVGGAMSLLLLRRNGRAPFAHP